MERNVSMTNLTTHDKVLERCEDIIKSENDKRLYRGLVLNNKMKVLLISDPTTDKSAAALTVNTGYMCDPDDLPGLAHLCEHMLLLGTEKYCEQNDYKRYMSENAGNMNASTHLDYTIFHFDVNPTKLTGGLERFAQFFVAPLFTDTLIKRELEAIHSEHLINMTSDNLRFNQLVKLSAKPHHPFSKFPTGNRETLDKLPKQMGINVRQRLIEFHEKYYSANVMSLCVLGAETLDELEELVVNLFSQVRNKEIDIPICSEHVFDDEHLCTKWYIVPIKNRRTLRVAFPIPDLQEHYQSKPLYYVFHMLYQEGSGSLSSVLNKKTWSNSIRCVKHIDTQGFDILMYILILTEEGIKHVDDIITLIFQYINMIKKHGPVEWIYNEYRDLEEMNFRFIEKQNPFSYVSSRVVELRKYPMKEILCGDCLVTQWKPDLIDSIMKCMTPKKIRVYVTSKAYEGVANETERWFETKYKKEKIPTEIIDMWENAGYNSELYLPAKNVFIPSRLDLKPRDDKVETFPTVILDTPFVRLWFKQDNEYLVPKAKIFLRFVSPYIQIDAVSFHLVTMHVDLLKNAFYQLVYPACLANLNWLFENTTEGITVSIYGYDEKQHLLLERIMDRMLNFEIYPEHLEELKKFYIGDLKNSMAQQPHLNVCNHLNCLLYEPVLTRDDLLRATAYVTVDAFQAFIPQLFSKVHVECLIHGNMIEEEALDIATMIESKLKSAMPHITPLEQRHWVLRREIKLDDGGHFLFRTKNEFHKSSCTAVYYQFGIKSTESSVLLELLAQIISEPCFNILRTQEQLGYIVYTDVHSLNITQGLKVVVRSEKHPRYVEKRIDLFFHSMLDYISNMSKEKFEKHKNSLVTLRVKKARNLFSKTNMFWNMIIRQTYNFNQVTIKSAYLKTVTQEQILNFFKENIHGPARRKLSLHIISTIKDNDESEEKQDEFDDMLATGQVVEIKDISLFKRSQILCPALEPCV